MTTRGRWRPSTSTWAQWPLHVERAIDVDEQVTHTYLAKVLNLYAVRGVEVDSGEPVTVCGFDVPVKVGEELSKIDLESRDVTAFLRTVRPTIDTESLRVEAGPHPNEAPDVVASWTGTSIGIETTQLHVPSRSGLSNMARWALFEEMRDGLGREGRRCEAATSFRRPGSWLE